MTLPLWLRRAAHALLGWPARPCDCGAPMVHSVGPGLFVIVDVYECRACGTVGIDRRIV